MTMHEIALLDKDGNTVQTVYRTSDQTRYIVVFGAPHPIHFDRAAGHYWAALSAAEVAFIQAGSAAV